MVDPVGTTLGVIGLVSLFSVCVECFDYIEKGRTQGTDFAILKNQLNGLRLRLSVWGDRIGITKQEHYDPRLNDTKLLVHIKQQLGTISLLFLNSDRILKKYGLEDRRARHARGQGGGDAEVTQDSVQGPTEKKTRIWNLARWVLQDMQSFEEVLKHLEPAIRHLEWIFNNREFLLEHPDHFETSGDILHNEAHILLNIINMEGDFEPTTASRPREWEREEAQDQMAGVLPLDEKAAGRIVEATRLLDYKTVKQLLRQDEGRRLHLTLDGERRTLLDIAMCGSSAHPSLLRLANLLQRKGVKFTLHNHPQANQTYCDVQGELVEIQKLAAGGKKNVGVRRDLSKVFSLVHACGIFKK
jgi:Prion-inhibition and propagation